MNEFFCFVCFCVGTAVCCYTCGVEFAKMARGEDVWRIHAQKSPSCQFVLREKSDAFVQQVLQEMGPYREPERQAILTVSPQSTDSRAA